MTTLDEKDVQNSCELEGGVVSHVLVVTKTVNRVVGIGSQSKHFDHEYLLAKFLEFPASVGSQEACLTSGWSHS